MGLPFLVVFAAYLVYVQNILAQDPGCHGAMFVPVILGSDKTTVSIATGQTDFYPLYGSIGNVHNSVRRAHKNAVALLGFLAIPKGTFSLNAFNLID